VYHKKGGKWHRVGKKKKRKGSLIAG
jgi:hypothetical protein